MKEPKHFIFACSFFRGREADWNVKLNPVVDRWMRCHKTVFVFHKFPQMERNRTEEGGLIQDIIIGFCSFKRILQNTKLCVGVPLNLLNA